MYSEQKQALAAELSFKHPAVLAVSGSAGSGKTALLAALLPVLKSRGLKVGVIREADDLRLPAETDRMRPVPRVWPCLLPGAICLPSSSA